ncbi:MAG TPA: GYD domain-containing protein [Acidimicrobiales bacterium]|jgi:uncharacterized protein with GYD domain
MATFLVRANYIGAGVKGLMSEGGTKRRAAVQSSVESVGGSMECFYYAFGDTDVYGVVTFPDDASATAWSLMINATSSVSLNLVPLMTPEDLDAAVSKTPSYRAPGA